ncbi:MAG: hypothetical protein ACFB51_12205 [Anaerolineae bacterium]
MSSRADDQFQLYLEQLEAGIPLEEVLTGVTDAELREELRLAEALRSLPGDSPAPEVPLVLTDQFDTLFEPTSTAQSAARARFSRTHLAGWAAAAALMALTVGAILLVFSQQLTADPAPADPSLSIQQQLVAQGWTFVEVPTQFGMESETLVRPALPEYSAADDPRAPELTPFPLDETSTVRFIDLTYDLRGEVDDSPFVRVSGLLQNASPEPIEFLTPGIVLRDADGRVIDDTSLGSTALPYLEPGTITPFSALIVDAPQAVPFQQVELRAYWIGFENRVYTRAFTVNQATLEPDPAAAGTLNLRVDFTLTDSEPVDTVTMVVVYLTGGGQFAGFTTADVLDEMAGGESAGVTVSLRSSSTLDQVEAIGFTFEASRPGTR